MGRFATGVAVITGRDGGGPAGLTTNALCSVSLEPPLVLVCFDNGSRTLSVVRESGRFGVNVLRAPHADLARAFASKAPHSEKFAGIAHREVEGVPVLEGALAWVACDLERLVPAGDHTIGLGAVRAMGHDDEGEPLVWFGGHYRAMA